MSSDLCIAISGKSGCGNSTVSRLVAARLGLRVINYTFKDLARDEGISFEELARLAETDSQYDLALDLLQVKMAAEGGCVLGSRLAIWLLRETAFTVYLFAKPETRAGRIAKREGLTPDRAFTITADRDKRDRERYLRLYGYDVDDYGFASLVIETDNLDAETVADRIVKKAGNPAP
jgi:cytidylate kinase